MEFNKTMTTLDEDGEGPNGGGLKDKLQMEEEKLVADILLVELENADNIDIDTDNKETKAEIMGISHDIVDITNTW